MPVPKAALYGGSQEVLSEEETSSVYMPCPVVLKDTASHIATAANLKELAFAQETSAGLLVIIQIVN